jgi:hypothetical protein
MDQWVKCQNVFNNHKYFEGYGDLFNFLSDCNLIEDWACGNSFFKSYVNLYQRNGGSHLQYVGLDDLDNPLADRCVDFKYYRHENSTSNASVAILLNTALHNYPYWKRIFINALESDVKKIGSIVPNSMIPDILNYMKIFTDYTFDYKPNINQHCSILMLTRKESSSSTGDVIPKNGRTAVCTIILHDYDVAKDVTKCPYNDIDFFLFTDNKDLSQDKGWNLLDADYHLSDQALALDIGGLKSISKDSTPNVICKYYKTSIHRIPMFKNYSRICVIDASLEIIDFSILKMSDDPIVFHRHPYRSDIVSEAKAATFFYRYAFQPVCQQADSYMAEGYPNEYLLASGYYVRDNDPKINRAFELWYLEIQKWTDLCQLSLLYSFWLTSMPKPFLIPDDIFCDKYLRFHHHKFNY